MVQTLRTKIVQFKLQTAKIFIYFFIIISYLLFHPIKKKSKIAVDKIKIKYGLKIKDNKKL